MKIVVILFVAVSVLLIVGTEANPVPAESRIERMIRSLKRPRREDREDIDSKEKLLRVVREHFDIVEPRSPRKARQQIDPDFAHHVYDLLDMTHMLTWNLLGHHGRANEIIDMIQQGSAPLVAAEPQRVPN